MSTSEASSSRILRPESPFRFDQDQGLFVIGAARSGTTLLAEALNLSPQVFLLEEAFLYRDAKEPNFCTLFNRRHQEYGNFKYKGRFVPYFGGRDYTAWELLELLAQRFRYVGEKVAMGPWIDWDEALLEFQAAHFYHSHYVLTFRHPAEVVWSMVKKFQQDPPEHHLRCWLRAFRVGVDILATFPRVYALFHDKFSQAYLERLCQVLGIENKIPPRMTELPYHLPSHVTFASLPEPLEPIREFLKRAHEVFDELRAVISTENFRYCGQFRSRDYYDRFRRRLIEIEEALQQWAEAASQQSKSAA